MAQTTSLEFQRQARHEPIEITCHGRREFVLMSAEQYDWLKAASQRAHKTVDALPVVIDAVEKAEMDAANSSANC
ncbi:UNVERIFIED_ORG: PHD/YefM family antitoxin component YafN of YafNO toxin-antitoxin module [Rhizobium aethiopicum]|uniref:type II toxin-antitoxin system prevent-host-death family antitoxin n=1 Tax=unclassified Rhizobium TaxID=2613769 RepID=UPI0008D961CC|nr:MULTISPECIES: type II toxin-antitoxin system prevent-host-death family antitoxin [unclassified Rhizobium]OHV23452.1 prevent-host-death protein [Rhizobium sp. RSm-3]RVU13450.1 type II toxin-antitoxin system Phd/YefM family antitoxin [Rhizobium sp. RMa-01]